MKQILKPTLTVKLERKNLKKIREINISNGPFNRSQRSEINCMR